MAPPRRSPAAGSWVSSKGNADETVLDRFEREEKNRDLIRILAGDPALSEEDFRTEEALTRVAKRTAMALGDRLEGFSTEMDQEHGRWAIVFSIRRKNQTLTTRIDRDLLKLPKFLEIKALLTQVAVLGEAPYRVGSEEGDSALEKVCETVDTLSGLIDCVISAGKKGSPSSATRVSAR